MDVAARRPKGSRVQDTLVYAMGGGQHTPYTTYFQDTCTCYSQPGQKPQSSVLLSPKTMYKEVSTGDLMSSLTPPMGHAYANQAGLKLTEVCLSLLPWHLIPHKAFAHVL